MWSQNFNKLQPDNVINISGYKLELSLIKFNPIFLLIFSPLQVGILLIAWIFSGIIFGVGSAYIVIRVTAKNGSSKWNDFTFKIVTTGLVIVEYVLLGLVIVPAQWSIFVILMILIVIGNLGNFGVIFRSFIQTLYPIISLIIGILLLRFQVLDRCLFLAYHQYIYQHILFYSNQLISGVALHVNSIQDKFQKIKILLKLKEGKILAFKSVRQF